MLVHVAMQASIACETWVIGGNVRAPAQSLQCGDGPQPYGFSMFSESAKLDSFNLSTWKTKVCTICMLNEIRDWLKDSEILLARVAFFESHV